MGGKLPPESGVLLPARNIAGVVADLPKYRCGESLYLALYDRARKWPDQSRRETRGIGRRSLGGMGPTQRREIRA